MKTRRFSPSAAPLLRAVRWFQIRAIETQIDGMTEAIEAVADPLLRQRIGTARAVARRELARVRSEYSALLPVGKRVVWRSA